MIRAIRDLIIGVMALLPLMAQQPDVLSVQMLDCSSVTSRPCFRARLSLNHPVRIPSLNTLFNNLAIEFDGIPVKPFYVSTSGQERGSRSRTAMVLLDISGSMNDKMSNGNSRFDAAKAAVEDFANDLDPAVDQVAIVPFESHHVIETIRDAQFVSSTEAVRAQLAAIPHPTGDTALYAAISTAIDVLQARQRRMPDGEYLLVVITDGKDDLGRDPDPELRRNSPTIDVIENKVAASKIPVYAIGIGGADDTDILAPLEQISIEHSHLVQEPDELAELLSQARLSLTSRIQITFQSPYRDAAQLQGQNHQIRVVLGQGPERAEVEHIWAPQEAMLTPQSRTVCDPAEARALSRVIDPSQQEDYAPIVRPVATFVVLGSILLICWFLLPRLVWPDVFAEELPKVDGGTRWASGRQSIRKPPGGASMPRGERQETEETYVLPKQQLDPKSRFK